MKASEAIQQSLETNSIVHVRVANAKAFAAELAAEWGNESDSASTFDQNDNRLIEVFGWVDGAPDRSPPAWRVHVHQE